MMQNKAIRTITNANYNDPVKPLFKSINIPPLDILHKIQLAKLMYQHSKNLLPSRIMALYTPNVETHNHNTRHKLDPHINNRRTQQYSKSFHHRGPDIWYALPEPIKSSTNLSSFKNKVTRLFGY